jgi:hypothetical protein
MAIALGVKKGRQIEMLILEGEFELPAVRRVVIVRTYRSVRLLDR